MHAAPPLLNFHRHALFLDLDGTLVDIAHTPEEVVAGKALAQLLRDIAAASSGAIALITGRTIAQADRILDGAIANIAGLHGLQQRVGDKITRDQRAGAELEAALSEVKALVTLDALPVRLEEKGASVALHYRHAPEAERDVRARAAQIAAKHNLRTLPGKMVIEIVAGAHTKGDAVDAFMREAPFAGRIPVAVGDDVTDEDAFQAVARLDGFAVRVGELPSALAAYRLQGPATVQAWLTASLQQGRAS